MLKGKKYDAEETFKSIIGFSLSNEALDEKTTNQEANTEQDSMPEKPLAVVKKPTRVKPGTPSVLAPKKKTAGRPKINRETKKRYTFTILPSLYERAAQKAEEDGFSLSEKVSYLLEEYTGEKARK